MSAPHSLTRRGLLLGSTAGTVLGLAACGSSSSAPDEDEVIIGTTNEPTSLDRNVGGSSGLSETLSRNVYEGLTTVDEAGEVIDVLAKQIDVSEDGLAYTFHLREEVAFHDGTPLTSADIAWSISETIGPDSKSARAADLRVITEIRTPDDRTVVLALKRRSASLRFFLASVTIVKDGDTKHTTDNGTGPYRLEEWVQGDHLTLVKNDEYWGEAARNPGVTFRFFADESAMNNALRSGELDLVLQQESPDQLPLFEDDADFEVSEGNSIQKWVWTFNNKVEPFTNTAVRQALYTAIDREAMLKAVWDGRGEVIGSMPPVGEPWYDSAFADIHAYDPRAAQDLLADAGAEGISFTLTYVPGTTEELVVQRIVSDLAAIGVTVQLEAIDEPIWYEQVYTEKNYETTLMSHNNPRDVLWYADPDFYWQYDNTKVQELNVAAEEAEDEDQQVDRIHRLSEIIADEAPSAWLFMAPQIRIARRGVAGYATDKNAEAFYVAQMRRGAS